MTPPDTPATQTHLSPTIGHPPPSLPTFVPLANSNFMWGEIDAAQFQETLKKAYDEVVHWRKNCFKLPLGNVGKSLVAELARLYNAFATGSALESIALMATTLLALQKPSQK